jgi:hypothetical protein
MRKTKPEVPTPKRVYSKNAVFESSDSDEPENFEVKIGREHQVEIYPMGGISELDPKCVLDWDPTRLPMAEVESYIKTARERWNLLGLNRNVGLDEEKACRILASVGYSPDKALKLIEYRLKSQFS